MPPEDGELSVFRTDGVSLSDVWALGSSLEQTSGKSIKGRAEFRAQLPIDLNLRTAPETTEHPRHANVLGWPADDPKRKDIAIQFEKRATLVRRPSPEAP